MLVAVISRTGVIFVRSDRFIYGRPLTADNRQVIKYINGFPSLRERYVEGPERGDRLW